MNKDNFDKKDITEAFETIVESDIRQINQNILPCFFVKLGVTIAAESSRNRINWFKQNVVALETLAVELNKQNAGMRATLVRGRRAIRKYSGTPDKFMRALNVAALIAKWFKAVKDRSDCSEILYNRVDDFVSSMVDTIDDIELFRQAIEFENEFASKTKVVGKEDVYKAVKREEGEWIEPRCPHDRQRSVH